MRGAATRRDHRGRRRWPERGSDETGHGSVDSLAGSPIRWMRRVGRGLGGDGSVKCAERRPDVRTDQWLMARGWRSSDIGCDRCGAVQCHVMSCYVMQCNAVRCETSLRNRQQHTNKLARRGVYSHHGWMPPETPHEEQLRSMAPMRHSLHRRPFSFSSCRSSWVRVGHCLAHGGSDEGDDEQTRYW